MVSDAADAAVYQLHVKLRSISPAIWRRILVRADNTIEDLHYTLQLAMGWTDSHLNRFIIHGCEYGVSHIGGRTFSRHASDVRLSEFGFRVRERFLYEYDFGDRWLHDIRLECRLAVEPQKTYPRCVGGRRACPPEDCGGPWGYQRWEDRTTLVDIEEYLAKGHPFRHRA